MIDHQITVNPGVIDGPALAQTIRRSLGRRGSREFRVTPELSACLIELGWTPPPEET